MRSTKKQPQGCGIACIPEQGFKIIYGMTVCKLIKVTYCISLFYDRWADPQKYLAIMHDQHIFKRSRKPF